MGRTLNPSRPARRGAVVIFRPAASGWQKWAEKEEGVRQLAGEAAGLEELEPAEASVIAVPVRRAFSLSLWVPADDPQIFGDLVYTQLELRGLGARSREAASFAWEQVATEGAETLLHAVVLPSNLAPRYWSGDVTNYSVSPACLPLEADTVALWREEGGWVASVTRGDKLVHFQALTAKDPDAAMALEVWLMLTALEAGAMVSASLPAVVFHEGGEAPDLESWRSSGGIPVQSRPLPPPVLPPAALELLPAPVRAVQETKAIRSRRQRLVLAAAAVYFLVVLAFAANTVRLSWKAGALQEEIGRDAGAVEATSAAMKRWEELEAAINPLGYPLEILYQAARLLPKDGVRLTLFEMNRSRVVIQGEASTFPAAQRFQDEVKKNPELAAYDWTSENPRSLPNGSARFQIDGVRHGAAAEDGPDTDEDSDI